MAKKSKEKRDMLIIGDHPLVHTGGVSTHVGLLSEILAQTHVSTSVIVLKEKKIISTKRALKIRTKKDVDIIITPSFLIHLIKIIQQGKRSQIINTHNLLATITARLVFPNKLIVRTVHGYYSLERVARNQLKIGSIRFKIVRKLEELGVIVPDFIITVDTRIKKWLIELKRRDDNIFTLLNVANVDEIEKILQSEEVSNPQKNATFHIRIGYAKGLTPKNGPEYLLLSCNYLREYRKFLEFIIIGDGELRSKLEELAKNTRCKITFYGDVEHERTIQLMKELFDILVVPSIKVSNVEEASSIVAQEAMYLGIPVIASSIGGLKEIILNYKTGILIPEKNPKKIAENIILIMDSPKLKKKMGYMGKVIQEKRFQKYKKELYHIYTLRVYYK